MEITVLLVGACPSDRRIVHEISRKCGWRLLQARNRRRALGCLARQRVHVVITADDLPDGDWQKVLADLHLLTPPPQLVVASRHADDYLWAEALNCGAFDVLSQPFDCDEVERAVVSAQRHFELQPSGAARTRTAAA